MSDKAKPAATDLVLDAPAKVGSARFWPGVKWSVVIAAAQNRFVSDHGPAGSITTPGPLAPVVEAVSRAEFETFWKWKRRGVAPIRINEFERLQDGSYHHEEVQRDYWVWTCARDTVMLERLYAKDEGTQHG